MVQWGVQCHTVAMSAQAPLAYRMRPTRLEDFVGQEEAVGEGSALRESIIKDALSSVILAGPPGTGKTSLARIIAEMTTADFVQLNAVTSGVKDIKTVTEQATRAQQTLQHRTVLFVDEIHRFNKSQQDALLPFVESGAITLIGATTQNPYFEVNQALLSRSQVYLLKPLSEDDLVRILQRALTDERGYSGKLQVEDGVLRRIAQVANGDARVALNSLELAVTTTAGKISLKDAERLLKERRLRYDKSDEDHYNVVSAFIKSMRGSDVDAALAWLYTMVNGGEPPRFLFRRMAIFASEDIGNADPHALTQVMSAWQAFEFVGMPEGEYFLAHACIYLAQAPKSNAVKRAMHAVKSALKSTSLAEVPNHLRNAPVKGMAAQGYGQEYVYPHDAPEGVVPSNYFPEGMRPQDFYDPTSHGHEAEIRERLQRARRIIRKTRA